MTTQTRPRRITVGTEQLTPDEARDRLAMCERWKQYHTREYIHMRRRGFIEQATQEDRMWRDMHEQSVIIRNALALAGETP